MKIKVILLALLVSIPMITVVYSEAIDTSASTNEALAEQAATVATSEMPGEAAEIYRLWKSGKKRKAFRAIEKWMKADKKSPYPYVVKASLKFEQGKFKRCLKLCKKAIKKKPQTGEAYYWRGRAYEALKKPLEAANEYRAALYAKQEFFPAKERLDQVLAQLNIAN